MVRRKSLSSTDGAMVPYAPEDRTDASEMEGSNDDQKSEGTPQSSTVTLADLLG